MDGNSNINEIIINDENKFDYFQAKIKSLNFSGKSSYKLVVVTCYFNVMSIKKLITNVEKILKAKKIVLAEIELFLDQRELYYEYSLNPPKIQQEIVNHFKERVTFKIPKSSQLFHPKAYCLMPMPNNDEINIGVAESGLFLGSANLSEKGFGAAKSSQNLELMYFTVDGTIIGNFHKILRDIETYDRKSLEELAKIIEEESTSKENSLYKWRLIKEGNFVYRENPGTIENNLEISYDYQPDESNTKDKDEKIYYFWDNKADNSISPKKKKAVDYFKQSNEYIAILDIFLRHNPTYEVDWGKVGINIFGNYYWLPKTLTDYLKDECKVLKDGLEDEIENLFNDNVFLKTDLDSRAVKKMAGDLKANWNNLSSTWKEKVFEKISRTDKKRLNIKSSQDLEECDKEQLAKILLEIKTTNFLEYSSQICKRYKLDDVDLIQKLRPNYESENTALLDYVYEEITQQNKNNFLGKCIEKAVIQTLTLDDIQRPRINRIDFLNEEQLGRLIEAHIRCLLVGPGQSKENQFIIKKEGESIEIEVKIRQEDKYFQVLKILIFSETEVRVNKVRKLKKLKEKLEKTLQKENWNNLIFIFRSSEDNPFREMKVYKESNIVNDQVKPIPITDEGSAAKVMFFVLPIFIQKGLHRMASLVMQDYPDEMEDEDKEQKMRFLYKIQKILESNLPKQPT